MKKISFEITEEEAGKRLDKIIAGHASDVSRSYVQSLFELGAVRVNGDQKVSKNHRGNQGDKIEVSLPDPVEVKIEAEDIPLDIVYEDEDLMVIDKPVGMVVHPAVGNIHGTLVNAIMHHCGDRLSSINGVVRPGIVHRIDKDTGGLLLVAKTDNAHRGLSEQFYQHTITRRYLALVQDNIKQDEGVVDLPIGRDPKNRLKKTVNGLGAKEAVTHYKVVERFGEYTLIECRLETGRTHQIRVHMSYVKHPLVGDPLYGSKKQLFDVKGQLLHAKLLGFTHPVTGEYLEFTSDIPEEFAGVLEMLRNKQSAQQAP